MIGKMGGQLGGGGMLGGKGDQGNTLAGPYEAKRAELSQMASSQSPDDYPELNRDSFSGGDDASRTMPQTGSGMIVRQAPRNGFRSLGR